MAVEKLDRGAVPITGTGLPKEEKPFGGFNPDLGEFGRTPLGQAVLEFTRENLGGRKIFSTSETAELLGLHGGYLSGYLLRNLIENRILLGVKRKGRAYQLQPAHVLVAALFFRYREAGYSARETISQLDGLLKETSLSGFFGRSQKEMVIPPPRGFPSFFTSGSPCEKFPLEAAAGVELGVRKKLLSEKVPGVSGKWIPVVKKYDQGELGTVLERIKKRYSFESVDLKALSVDKPIAQVVMFIGAAYHFALSAKEKEVGFLTLSGQINFDPSLEGLTNRQLKEGVGICVSLLGSLKNHQNGNLWQLFGVMKKLAVKIENGDKSDLR